ncbi:fimbriae usher protein [Salmonella enterica subsp. arizonae]|uniref:Fimbriae usher protein n=1 Tax=Salmonella enterica subsp. arizonae TaxID=59203 RepID=A0A3S4K774_SALER|nr:fimbriae usher protein [Salmonella enterica subsp. arizonae]
MLLIIMAGLRSGPGHGVPIIASRMFAARYVNHRLSCDRENSPCGSRCISCRGSSQVPFHVSLECESGAVSSPRPTISAANVAMGFVVNQPTAVAAAHRLGLTTSAGGLSWLLDTHYGEPGVASGVGIRIYNDAGTPINLLPDRIKTGAGNARGWYGYKDLTTRVSSGSVETYSGDFTASLEAIGGQTVTAGKRECAITGSG